MLVVCVSMVVFSLVEMFLVGFSVSVVLGWVMILLFLLIRKVRLLVVGLIDFIVLIMLFSVILVLLMVVSLLFVFLMVWVKVIISFFDDVVM